MEAADRRAAVLLFAGASLVLALGAFYGFPPSGGKSLAGALRILDGEVPYRDFWSMYAPGQFYATTALLAVFGRDMLVPALAAVLLSAGSAALLFRLLRCLEVARRAALAFGALFALASFETAPELDSYPPALFLILLALLRLRVGIASVRSGPLVQAGLCFGLAACFKHDVAFYACAASGGALIAIRRWKSIAAIAAGALAVLVPAVLALALAAGSAAWRDLIEFPAGDFLIVRGESYPPFLPQLAPWREWLAAPGDLQAARSATTGLSRWILAHLPEVLFLALAARFLRRLRELDRVRAAFAVLALAALPMFWAAAHVQQNTHLYSMAVMSALAWAALGPYASAIGRRLSLAAWTLYAVGLCIPAAQDAALALRALDRSQRLDLPGARWTWVSNSEADVYRPIAEFTAARVPPGEPIYCGVARNDAVVVGNQRWHMLCDRPPAVRVSELHPGVSDREDVARETIAALESRGVRCAILWRFGWSDALLDDILRQRMQKLPGTGSTLLDRYLAEHFEPLFERGEYVVLMRKDS